MNQTLAPREEQPKPTPWYVIGGIFLVLALARLLSGAFAGESAPAKPKPLAAELPAALDRRAAVWADSLCAISDSPRQAAQVFACQVPRHLRIAPGPRVLSSVDQSVGPGCHRHGRGRANNPWRSFTPLRLVRSLQRARPHEGPARRLCRCLGDGRASSHLRSGVRGGRFQPCPCLG